MNVRNGGYVTGYIFFSVKLGYCNISLILKLNWYFNILQEQTWMLVRHEIRFLKHFGTILTMLSCPKYDTVSLPKILTEEMVFY
jgi:hypothetical protein